MTEFRLTQLSDTHLSEQLPQLQGNFARVAEHIDRTRPDLVVNTGDVSFDGVNDPSDLHYARAMHDQLPVPCRFIPGNHDIGDNPTRTGAPPRHTPTGQSLRTFVEVLGDDRFSFSAAGWHFIGINALVMNTGLAEEEDQLAWLGSELARIGDRPLALFTHKPLFRTAPDDIELPETAQRYSPVPARAKLLDLLGTTDLRLVASGHVHQSHDYTFGHTRHIWAPSTTFVIASDARQARVGEKKVGLVEYCFRPEGFEVRFVRAPGQDDIDLHAAVDLTPYGY